MRSESTGGGTYEHIAVVGAAEAGGRVPATSRVRDVAVPDEMRSVANNGMKCRVLAALLLGALVGASGDLVEGVLLGGGHLVEQRVDEAQGGLLLTEEVVVQEREDARSDGGRSGGLAPGETRTDN